jgi:hypothetical protein
VYSLRIADEIRMAVAPVFLLTALMMLLTLLTTRLVRCVDRARSVMEERSGSPDHGASDACLRILRRRLWLIQWSIRCVIAASVLVCLIVVTLFSSEYLLPDLTSIIVFLFVGAMALLMVGLGCLFGEIGFAVSRADVELWD